MLIALTRPQKVFRVFNSVGLGLFSLITLYPLYYVLISSFSHPALGADALFWVKEFYYATYYMVFTTPGIWHAYLVTILRVATAVPLMLIVTGAAAFALSRKELADRVPIIFSCGHWVSSTRSWCSLYRACSACGR